MSEEIWKDIDGYVGFYQVSNLGIVRSLNRVVKNNLGVIRPLNGKRLSQGINKGYGYVALCKDGVSKMYSIHKLVAMAFLNHDPNNTNLEIDHIDGDKLNNKVENLEIVTHSVNIQRWYDKNKYASV